MRYESQKDTENDCLTLIDNEDELKTSFDSEIILYPLEGAEQIVDKLNWYEAVVQEMKSHLEYYDWTEEDFKKTIIEEVEANLEWQDESSGGTAIINKKIKELYFVKDIHMLTQFVWKVIVM